MSPDTDPFTRIWRRIWTDSEFEPLSPDAKWTYVMLCSQPEYNSAGLLTVALKRWARYTGISQERVLAAVQELDAAGFVVFDEENDQLLVRTKMRNDTLRGGSWKNHKGALTTCLKAISPRIRVALAGEILTAIDEVLITGDLTEYAREIVAELRRDACIEAEIEASIDTDVQTYRQQTADSRRQTADGQTADAQTADAQTADGPSAAALRPPKDLASRVRNAREDEQ